MNCCFICENTENLNRIHVYKGDISYGETHYDGNIYLCNDCLSKMKKCDKCGQLIIPTNVKHDLNGWRCFGFCQCVEELYEKLKRKKIELKKKNEAKELEKKIFAIDEEEIKDRIVNYDFKDWILDCDAAKIFETTTNNIRDIINVNKKIFIPEYVCQLNAKDVIILEKEFSGYKTSTSPFIISAHGMILLASFFETSMAKKFIIQILQSFIKSENKIEDSLITFLLTNMNFQVKNVRFLKNNNEYKDSNPLSFCRLPEPKEFVRAFMEEKKRVSYFLEYFGCFSITDNEVQKFIDIVEDKCKKDEEYGYIYGQKDKILKQIFSFVNIVQENIENNYLLLEYGTNSLKNVLKYEDLYNKKRCLYEFIEKIGLEESKQVKEVIQQQEEKIIKQKKIKKWRNNFLWILSLILYLIFYCFCYLYFQE